MPLIWTTQKPTKPGWYWYRGDAVIMPQPVQIVECFTGGVSDEKLNMFIAGEPLGRALPAGEWAGPIEAPEG